MQTTLRYYDQYYYHCCCTTQTLLSGVGLIISGQINLFFRMVADTGVILLLLGLSGAIGQVFIFVTISKFGALTCSIIGTN
jgi:solute carrier family 35 (UDP-galactose transporter), member B1